MTDDYEMGFARVLSDAVMRSLVKIAAEKGFIDDLYSQATYSDKIAPCIKAEILSQYDKTLQECRDLRRCSGKVDTCRIGYADRNCCAEERRIHLGLVLFSNAACNLRIVR